VLRDWLVKLRGNMSTGDVAKKLGISQQYYSYIENGKRQKKMDIQMCERIAMAFGIDISDVVRYESEREKEDLQ
jgi:transcriptional regulator with XRE-family HTH domain